MYFKFPTSEEIQLRACIGEWIHRASGLREVVVVSKQFPPPQRGRESNKTVVQDGTLRNDSTATSGVIQGLMIWKQLLFSPPLVP